jgi:diaminopimelate decarboxylase
MLNQIEPITYSKDASGVISLGGIEIRKLAKDFGTPLMVLCAKTLAERAHAYQEAFKKHYSADSLVIYASKALNTLAVCQKIAEYGLGIDVVSGGELYTAIKAGFNHNKIIFHGNNKSKEELKMAIEHDIGAIMLDNFYEIKLIRELYQENTELANKTVNLMIRITPGIECHTHEYIKTGKIDSKFGFNLQQVDEVMEALQELQKSVPLNIKGLHAHIGSQIFETIPHQDTAEVLLTEYSKIAKKYNIEFSDLNVGGGLGIKYTKQDDPPEIDTWVELIAKAVEKHCEKLNLKLPRILVEPGRSLVGPAGVTIYEVGNIKHIPQVNKTYIAVDGGMADNVRPIMYQADYHSEVDAKASGTPTQKVCIAGKYCESGDILIPEVELPEIDHGDLLIIFATGAYNYSMASNYNRSCKPAMILVEDGKATEIIKRESYEDLVAFEVML